MLKGTGSAIMLTLLLTSMPVLAFNIQPVKAFGTIYLRADGSIDPPTAPISTMDNVTYAFIDNINGSLWGSRDSARFFCLWLKDCSPDSGVCLTLFSLKTLQKKTC